MKLSAILLFVLTIFGCSYSSKVVTLSDETLCKKLGQYTLYDHKEGVSLTRQEITSRKLDPKDCTHLANSEIDRLAPNYKLQLCQNLAAYHYKGAYTHFKNTLDKIQALGFADEECNTMADFYFIRLTRKQEKAQAISDALTQAAENIRRSSEQLYGRGSMFNPIHIKIE